MSINHSKKLIFVHVPKNAGTSIMKMMDEIFFDATIDEYKNHYKKYWDEYLKFSVVRHPIDKFVSAYKFFRMEKNTWFSADPKDRGIKQKHQHYDICKSMDINSYVKMVYNNPRLINRWTVPQHEILCDENKNLMVDYLCRFETLHNDLLKINIVMNEVTNFSTIEDENLIKLSEKSISLLCEIYEEDFQLFDYQYNKKLNYC